MAVVGRAEIVVRALTSQVADDIKRGFNTVDREVQSAGARAGNSYKKGFESKIANMRIGKFLTNLREIAPGGEEAAKAFTDLVRKGYYLQSGLGALAGTIGSIIGGLGALIGSAGLAAASVVALGGAMAAAATGFALMKFALGGIGAALKTTTGGGGSGVDATAQALKNLALTVERNAESLAAANENVRSAQIGLNDAYKEGAEYLQQLGFEAEDAALSQERAAMSLEEARENLARVQDLPPNSRARREAELAFKEADLNYRQAADRSSDLATEQERYAQNGVDATDVVIQAKERLRQAEEDLARTVRDNLRAQIEAEQAVAKARTSGASAGVAAYDKLTKSQKKFADFLKREIQPQLVGLREEVAQGFLPMLEIQMRRLSKAGLFAEIRDGFDQVGDSLGLAVKNFTDQLMKSGAIDDLGKFFTMVANVMPKVGSILGSVFSSILTIFDAASPLVDKFTAFIDGKAADFAKFLDTKNATGQLETFFTRAGEVAGQFGQIFGNLFNGFGDIIAANFGPGSGGDLLLEYMIDASDGWANMNQTFLENYFVQAAENTMALGNSLGILVDILAQAGGSPEIEKFYNTLNQGAYYLEYLVQEALKASAPLAQIILGLTKLAAAFADSGSAVVFLNVVSSLVNGFASLAQTFKPLLDFFGPILAGFSALGFVMGTVNKVKTIMIGLLSNLTLGFAKMGIEMTPLRAAMGSLSGEFTKARDAGLTLGTSFRAAIGLSGGMTASIKVLGTALKTSLGPIGLILIGLEALMAAITFISGEIEKQFQARVEATTVSLKANASAIDTVNAALGKTGDTFNKFDTSDMTSALEAVRDETTNLTKVNTSLGRSYSGMYGYAGTAFNQGLADVEKFRGSLDEVGASLAQVATTDIRAAQQALQGFKTSTGATTAEFIELTGGVEAFGDEYVKSLQTSAAAEGISLVGKNGLIDAQLAMNYALGEGEVAFRREAEAAKQAAIDMGAASYATAERVDVMASSFKDGKFQVEGFMDAMKENAKKLVENLNNIQTAQANGLSQQAVDYIKETYGAQAYLVFDEIATYGPEKLAEMNNAILGQTGEFSSAMAQATAAGATQIQRQAKIAYDKGLIDNATFIGVINGTIKDWKPPAVKITADTSSFSLIETNAKLAADKAKATVKVSAVSQPKSGTVSIAGISIPFKFSGFKNGGMVGGLNMMGFANGGMVSGGGYGGGRSDRIPAMLSNGEYVVNSAATARNLSTLNAINYGGAAGSTGSTVNITVNPSPGMDERELASVVSQELMRQMRRGSI